MKEYDAYSKLLTGNDIDAALLDAWLDERQTTMEQDSVELPEEIVNARQDNVRLSAAAGDYDSEIAAGDIRILSKRYTHDPDTIPYVAVVEKWEEDNWLVVPFSAYTYPATPGEMVTGDRHLGLRVLQAWNARTVQTKLLEKSFLFGKLDERVRQNAADLFRHEFSGKELPSDFNALTGPEVSYSADPRRDYMSECIARLRPLSTAVKATARLIAESEAKQNAGGGGVIVMDWPEAARPFWGKADYDEALAAGNETEVTENFTIGDDELAAEYSPDERKARLTVYDSGDKPDAAYDGYGIIGRDGEFLGVFRRGSITVASDSIKDGFEVVDVDGEPVSIKKRD